MGIQPNLIHVMQLNGWQRLWIFASIIWLCVLTVVMAYTWPHARPIYWAWASQTENRISQASGSRSATGHPLQTGSQQFLSQKSHKPAIEPNRHSIFEAQHRYNRHHSRKVDFSKINRRHEQALARVNAEQHEYLVIGAIFAIGPIIIAYGLGMGVARVRRALRDEDDREE